MGEVTGFLKHDRQSKDYQAVEERKTHFNEFVSSWEEKDYKNQAARCMD